MEHLSIHDIIFSVDLKLKILVRARIDFGDDVLLKVDSLSWVKFIEVRWKNIVRGIVN